MNPRVMETIIQRIEAQSIHELLDSVAVEEPLEIRVRSNSDEYQSLSITMRTPGSDRELAAGFLFTEGIINGASGIQKIQSCGTRLSANPTQNVIRVDLAATNVDIARLKRNFYVTSSCGVCGKSSLEQLEQRNIQSLYYGARVHSQTILGLPDRLKKFQPTFQETGGLHAAALFDMAGDLVQVYEDVGRHNAMDKLIGSELLRGRLPLQERMVLVSGRASFELVQKALMAGIPIFIAVGAPSSLAIALAKRFEMSLIGFVRGSKYNVYHGASRVLTSA